MSYRLRLDGKIIECDTAIEAIDLLRAVRESGKDIQLDFAIGVAPPPMPIHQMSPKHPQEARVSSRVTEFLAALKESFPSPMTVAQMAARLDTTPKGLPPVIVGVRVLLKRSNVSFEDIIERKQLLEGTTKIGQYRLTSKGMKVLQDQLGEKSDPLPLAEQTNRRVIELD